MYCNSYISHLNFLLLCLFTDSIEFVSKLHGITTLHGNTTCAASKRGERVSQKSCKTFKVKYTVQFLYSQTLSLVQKDLLCLLFSLNIYFIGTKFRGVNVSRGKKKREILGINFRECPTIQPISRKINFRVFPKVNNYFQKDVH